MSVNDNGTSDDGMYGTGIYGQSLSVHRKNYVVFYHSLFVALYIPKITVVSFRRQ